MAKLYPPSIEGTIPAFSDYTLEVPFVMNKTVSWSQIDGFYARIRSIQTNELLLGISSTDYNKETQCVYFNILSQKYNQETGKDEQYCKLKVGVSYKVQIAYKDKDGQVGYYSTVGIVKYTAAPVISIVDLVPGELHANRSTYLGKYSQFDGDASEKVYSYKFTVYNPDGSILDTTGDKLHNHENDEYVYESVDSYTLNKTLERDKVYTIEYSIITSNGMKKTSYPYRITEATTVDPDIKVNIIAEMNEENGYVSIKLLGYNDDTGNEMNAVGTFVLSRSSSEDNFKNWYEVQRFALLSERPSTFKCRDFTVEHGFEYQYSLQQYNKEYGVYSNRLLSNTIIANFEHSFLYDGEKQLKIKYNPKVSSFKETLLETKTNTLGSKYPFFYRNGNVGYKEFPISGLISYLMDEEELFLSNEDMLLDNFDNLTRQHTLKPGIKSQQQEYFDTIVEQTGDYTYAYGLQNEYAQRELDSSNENLITYSKPRTTNLIDYNILAERIFKIKVLEWLNNGKPKLFRSPGEGNYLVRLMNSSLSPDDKLNRMLHTFNTTATEIDSADYLTLNSYDIISISEPSVKQMHWKTLLFKDILPLAVEDFISIGEVKNIYSIECQNMIPNDIIKLVFQFGDKIEEKEIRIGITGAYSARFSEPINTILVSAKNSLQGQITYSYQEEALQQFDTYRAIHMSDLPLKQFIGEQKNEQDEDINLFNLVEDLKNKVSCYYFANFTKRPVSTITLENGVYYLNGIEVGNNFVPNPLYIYLFKQVYYDGQYFDLNNLKVGTISTPNYKIYIDDKEIDLEEILDYQLPYTGNIIPKIIIGSGVVADLSIQRREIEYDVEQYKVNEINNQYEYIEEKQKYLDQLEIVKNLILYKEVQDYDKELKQEKEKLNKLYNEYIQAIENKLKAKEVIPI